jgi:hypothetical protein
MQYYVALKGLLVLVLNPGWLALFPPLLVEGKLRLYQQFGGVEMTHLPVLVFPMVEVQWKLRGWTVVPASPLGVKPYFDCISPPAKSFSSLLSPVKHRSMLLQ